MASYEDPDQGTAGSFNAELFEQEMHFEATRSALYDRLREERGGYSPDDNLDDYDSTIDLALGTADAFGALADGLLQGTDRAPAIDRIVDIWYRDGLERMQLLNGLGGSAEIADFGRADVVSVVAAVIDYNAVPVEGNTLGGLLGDAYQAGLLSDLTDHQPLLGVVAAQSRRRRAQPALTPEAQQLQDMGREVALNGLHLVLNQ